MELFGLDVRPEGRYEENNDGVIFALVDEILNGQRKFFHHFEVRSNILLYLSNNYLFCAGRNSLIELKIILNNN